MSDTFKTLNCGDCNFTEYIPKQESQCIYCGSKNVVAKVESEKDYNKTEVSDEQRSNSM